MTRKPRGAAWVRCPCCENFWCNIHKRHAYECDCPPVEDWQVSPYDEGSAMEQEQRENIKAANKRRANHCQKCGGSGFGIDTRDGADIGGIHGCKYRCCNACGHKTVITHRKRREKNNES